MKKRWNVLGILLLSMLFSAQTQKQQRPLFVEGEIVVKFESGDTSTRGLLKGLGLSKTSAQNTNVTILKDEMGRDIEKVCEDLRQREDVVFAEPNYLYYASEIPNDPDFSKLWGLKNSGQTGGVSGADINAEEAWNIQSGDEAVLVGVIDTGVDYEHPDLVDNIWNNPGEIGIDSNGNDKKSNGEDDDNNGYVDDWRGWDFVNNDNEPMDDNVHGTHVAGTIGAVGNNSVGVVGVNWKVRIMSLKFLSSNGSGSLADAIDAIAYANAKGVKILNNSWGGGGRSRALEDAIKQSNNAGVLFVAASGNEGNDNDANPSYPASYEVANVLSVAAMDDNGRLATFGAGGGGGGEGLCGCGSSTPAPTGIGSNFGATSVDLAAPGEDIFSTMPNNRYGSLSGTSMATPHVSGVAALVLAQFPGITNTQLKQRLMNSVDQRNSLSGKMVTGGSINALKAVSGSLTLP